MNNEIPVFVERDPDAIMAECIETLEEFLGRKIHPGQVEQLMLNFIVYREVLLTNRFNAGMAKLLYQFSTAPILDYVASLVAVERLPAARSRCNLIFNLEQGHALTHIPEGTCISDGTGEAVFEIVKDVLIAPNQTEVTAPAYAQKAGPELNGFEIGEINKLVDPLDGVDRVYNSDVTGGGSDLETDEQLRERIRLAPSQFSSAGSRTSYIFHAKSSNTLITDIYVTSVDPGKVLIYPLVDDMNNYSQVKQDIERICTGDKVRPLTDRVWVEQPVKVEYKIVAKIVLDDDADKTVVPAQVKSLLYDYVAEKRKKLGQNIIVSEIVELCRIDGVYDVHVSLPVGNISPIDGNIYVSNIQYAEHSDEISVII